MRPTARLLSAACIAAASATAGAQTALDFQGVASAIRLDQIVTGHLAQANGKFKLRASEIFIDPGGYVGHHQHVGPGIRYVVEGEITLVEPSGETVFRAGDFFYEAGDVTHRTENRGVTKAQLLQIELLPVDFKGRGTTYPAPPLRQSDVRR